MRRLSIAVLGLLALATSQQAVAAEAGGWLDRSHQIFFPPGLQETIGVQQGFPVFWWNFVVLGGEVSGPELDAICASLKALPPGLVRRVECGQSLRELQPLLTEWTRDLAWRVPRPSIEQLRARMDSALSKASLPSADPAFLSLLRLDPLDSWQDLQRHAAKRVRLGFERKDGFFFDPASRRTVIPVQLGYEPSLTGKTREVRAAAGPAIMIGPHASALRNEERITADVAVVSWVGTLVLVVFALTLILSGRWRLALLVPPVLGGMAVSTGLTVLIFGSIHGLTLSFGTGIIGLAVDYGLHAALSRNPMRVWRSNLFGVLTTGAGLTVLMGSSIPLLRQLMVFSIIGLVAAFLALVLCFRLFPGFFSAPPYPFSYRPRPWKFAAALVLLGAAVAGLATIRPNLDMRQLDYQDPATRGLDTWLFKSMKTGVPVFRLHDDADVLRAAHEEQAWAGRSGLNVENVASYLPAPEVQERNLKTWAAGCAQARAGLSADQNRFFLPFLEAQLCRPAGSEVSTQTVPPARAYLDHLRGNGRWLSLWLPASEREEALIRVKYPDAIPLRKLATAFPERLAGELRWMAPLSLLIAVLLLLGYYRGLAPAVIALLPFMTGLGLVVLAKLAFGLEVSFMSLIGLIIVFGFSIDYGIFVVDMERDPEGDPAAGVWTAITAAALTNLAGFAPLLFCHHPVLRHLGQALFFGTLGTYAGAAWGIPPAMKAFSRPTGSPSHA